MTRSKDVGDKGENIATRFLKKKGYKIVERNYLEKWGEIDIIAISTDRVLVFVEVKTVTGPVPIIEAEEQLTRSKLLKLQKTAMVYANNNEELTSNGWQIDLVAITIYDDNANVRHYTNI